MTPQQVAASYDQIATQWLAVSTYGFAQIERAITFTTHKGTALDVGCGTGRLMGLLHRHGFRTDGVDASPAMVALARERHPDARLDQADIGQWDLPRSYDLIVAWDSIWHVPLAEQEGVLTKLCRGLAADGVLVFTTGGTDGPSEKQNSYMGPPIYHAALGLPRTLQILADAGCLCRHLEYDQHPELHVYIIAQKRMDDAPPTGGVVRLRNVARDDLPQLYEWQLDPESNRLAVTNPRTAEAFDALWNATFRDPSATAKAILLGDMLVGTIVCFRRDGLTQVGYWIRRDHWGRGIASRALELLLLEVATRPLYAHAATSNAPSLRVLQKNGFVIERVQMSPATDRYPACEEAVLVLHGPSTPHSSNADNGGG